MEVILRSVGRKGKNHYKDVSVVQTLLNACSHLMGPVRLLSVDGRAGSNTNSVIELFQSTVLNLKDPDGRVDPGGKTIRTLNVKALKPMPVKNTAFFTDITKSIFGVKPDSGYKFPLSSRSPLSYKTGMRRFGSRRGNGRLHAGCDLYAPVGTKVFALADGIVETAAYKFYLGTYAIEIKHTEFLALYGELGLISSTLTKGAKVKKGQFIGEVGQLNGLDMSMLHLEVYSGTGRGKLTVRSNLPYKRRADIMDPTPILDKAK